MDADTTNLKIRDMYLGGMGLPKIAHALGRSQTFVSGRLKKAGVELRKPGNPQKERLNRRVPESDLGVAVQRYKNGESAKAIERSGNVSKPTLIRELRRLGIEIRMQATGRDSDIVIAYQRGLSVNQIEKTIGCTKRRASNVLKAHGINFRERLREKTSASRAAACKRRENAIRQATPAWADRNELKAIYAECRRISIETGKKHHVDHFYPLRSELVCGLHVPANLSVITERQNVAKKNKIEQKHLDWVYLG